MIIFIFSIISHFLWPRYNIYICYNNWLKGVPHWEQNLLNSDTQIHTFIASIHSGHAPMASIAPITSNHSYNPSIHPLYPFIHLLHPSIHLLHLSITLIHCIHYNHQLHPSIASIHCIHPSIYYIYCIHLSIYCIHFMHLSIHLIHKEITQSGFCWYSKDYLFYFCN